MMPKSSPICLCRAWLSLFAAAAWTVAPGVFAQEPTRDLSRELAGLAPDARVLNIPEGVYNVTNTLQVTRPGLTIQGAGIGKTVLVRAPGLDGPLVKLNAPNSSISKLTLDENGGEAAIALKQDNTVADGIEVKNFRHLGIVVPGSGCRVTYCIVTGMGSPDIKSIGIWHDSGPNVVNSRFTVDHNTISDNGLGGLYNTGGKLDVIANKFIGNHHQLEPTGGGQMCIGNNGRPNANTNATISDNTIINGGGLHASGIETEGGSYTITNNTIRNHGMAGIVIGVNASHALISGNIISDCGQNVDDRHAPAVRSGIYVLYGANDVEITNNRVFDDQANKTQTWGVLFVGPKRIARTRFPTHGTDHLIVRNNDFRGSLHGEGVLDQSQARDRNFSGNLPAESNR